MIWIPHGFRHFIKGIRNRIFKSAKGVKSRSLVIWQKSVVNMIWWSLGTSKGRFAIMHDNHKGAKGVTIPLSWLLVKANMCHTKNWLPQYLLAYYSRQCSPGKREDHVNIAACLWSPHLPLLPAFQEMWAWGTGRAETLDCTWYYLGWGRASNLFFTFKGSKAMQKLRSSICGKRGKNLDDMEHMTGNIYIE